MKNDQFGKAVLMFCLAAFCGISAYAKDPVVVPPTDTTPTQFEGIWICQYPPNEKFENLGIYEFRGNTYSFKTKGKVTSSGVFSFTDMAITFYPAKGKSWTQNYGISGGNSLTLAQSGRQWWGPFGKAGALSDGAYKHVAAEKSKNATIVLRGASFTYTWDGGGGKEGTFKNDGQNIVFTTTAGDIWVTRYTAAGNWIWLWDPGSWWWYGLFQK
jgi:hypothetical protein